MYCECCGKKRWVRMIFADFSWAIRPCPKCSEGYFKAALLAQAMQHEIHIKSLTESLRRATQVFADFGRSMNELHSLPD